MAAPRLYTRHDHRRLYAAPPSRATDEGDSCPLAHALVPCMTASHVQLVDLPQHGDARSQRCVAGSVRLSLFAGRCEESIDSDSSAHGLLIGPGLWRDMYDFYRDCVLMVFGDAEYDEADYIQNPEEFLKCHHGSRP